MIKNTLLNICKFINRNKVRVMLYHRVNKYGDWFGIDTDIFEKQIEYLGRNFNLISLQDFYKILNKELIVKKPLLLTFDDGYLDNYTDAYPVLKKYSAPAVIFLTADFIDNKMWIWHDQYRHILENTPLKEVEYSLNGDQYNWSLNNKIEKLKARKDINGLLKNLPRSQRIQELSKFAKSLKIDIPEHPTDRYAPLSWDNIKEMSKNNIAFGAHTCTHEILSKLKNEDAHYELLQSKKRIEEELQLEVNAFAYPNGQDGDFTDETKMLIKKSSYKLAFTTLKGMNNATTDKFSIKRIPGGDTFGDNFFSEVSGLNIIREKIAGIPRQIYVRLK